MSEGDRRSGAGSGVEGAGEPGSVAAARALGEQLRLLRENAGLSQRAMVALHGGSITSVSRYENGDRLPRSAYVEALLEEADRRGRAPLTTAVRELVTALYERALGPVGGRNSERAALYEQERALREVQDREAETARLLAELAEPADQGQDPQAGTEASDGVGARAAQLERLSGHLAVQRQRILGEIDRLVARLPGEGSAELVPHQGMGPFPEPVSGTGHEAVPPWKHRLPLAGLAAVLIAVAAIIWGAVLLQRGNPAPGQSPIADAGPGRESTTPTPNPTPSPSPTPSPTPTPTSSPTPPTPASTPPSSGPAPVPPPSSTPPPASEPPAPTVPETVRVRWRGTLTLDDGSKTGIPTTGWFLDPVPPQRAPLGDLGLSCQLSCDPGRYVGKTIVAFKGPGTPDRQKCVDLLNTNLGQRTADVPAGRPACFGTEAGRVGYFTPGTGNGGQVKLQTTVWELPD
ncbi:helix-turn-helix domain-containing protein [Streptomyces sp. NBC_01244]|uniref:helix-turn-helix domain-containing protein n=1 Tax=Streptomyces sp. NBC_01244 TaxID=2903797 RepID=UPI002E152A69|nr:helix-turn-helix domain-containing protein [Streptomyces sp. NBC_01244]